jgi:hypothetical protein
MVTAQRNEHVHGEDRLTPLTSGRSPVVAGLAAAAITALLLVGWRLLERWYIFGSAYTDLPGQNSLALVSRVQLYVFALITLVAGRVAGLLCNTRRLLATLIGVSPMLLPVVLLFLGFGQKLEAVLVGSLVCLIGLLGAYVPTWLVRRRVSRAV